MTTESFMGWIPSYGAGVGSVKATSAAKAAWNRGHGIAALEALRHPKAKGKSKSGGQECPPYTGNGKSKVKG